MRNLFYALLFLTFITQQERLNAAWKEENQLIMLLISLDRINDFVYCELGVTGKELKEYFRDNGPPSSHIRISYSCCNQMVDENVVLDDIKLLDQIKTPEDLIKSIEELEEHAKSYRNKKRSTLIDAGFQFLVKEPSGIVSYTAESLLNHRKKADNGKKADNLTYPLLITGCILVGIILTFGIYAFKGKRFKKKR